MELKNNNFSFVQFAQGSDPPVCGMALPFKDNGDLRFQVVIEGSQVEIDAVMETPLDIYMLPLSAAIPNRAAIFTNKIAEKSDAFDVYRVSATKAILSLTDNVYDPDEVFTLPAIGGCFRLAITFAEEIEEENPYWLSACFARVGEEQYVTKLTYYSEGTKTGFTYCSGFQNIVKLPLFVAKPQFREDRKVYFTTDGFAQTQKSTVRKEFQGFVDHLAEIEHERLIAALSHDRVFIESNFYTGEIARSEGYEIDWPESVIHDRAPASFKAFATPYDLSGNACSNCEEYEEVINSCTATISAVNITETEDGYLVEWGVATGDPTKFLIFVNSDDPIETTELTLLLESLPNGENNIVVMPICTIEGIDYNGTSASGIIIVDTCIPIAIVGSSSLPNATAGTPYSKNLVFSGTLPLGLEIVDKPGWMMATITGNVLSLSGTPTGADVAEGVPVNIEISNCSGSPVVINQLIDIVEAEEPEGTVSIINESPDYTIEAFGPVEFFDLPPEATVPPLNSLSAGHGTGTVAISVTLTGSGGASTLRLYRNGGLMEVKPVTVADTYVFAAIAFALTDIIEIKLSML